MRQHEILAQKKASQRPPQPHVYPEQKRFDYKSTTESDYRGYNSRDSAPCKASFPRTKRKDGFFFKPGEYSCGATFPQRSVEHQSYQPRMPIPSMSSKKPVRGCDVPPFEGMSSYHRDFRPPPIEAYAVPRRARRTAVFN